MLVAGDAAAPHSVHYPLGPALGQCCGGAVTLSFTLLDAAMVDAWPAAAPLFHLQLYGAGHVGRAIVQALAPLPVRIDWIDEREEEFARHVLPISGCTADIRSVCVDAVEAEVRLAPPGAFYLVLTHEHDLDLRITEAILRRGDFGYLGLIGSKTKRQRFFHRFEQRGIASDSIERITCPIGVAGHRRQGARGDRGGGGGAAAAAMRLIAADQTAPVLCFDAFLFSMPDITLIDADGATRHEFEAPDGVSLMQAATGYGVPGILGECGGQLNCATCHVIVDPAWADRLPAPSAREAEMLGYAAVRAKPRAGCRARSCSCQHQGPSCGCPTRSSDGAARSAFSAPLAADRYQPRFSSAADAGGIFAGWAPAGRRRSCLAESVEAQTVS